MIYDQLNTDLPLAQKKAILSSYLRHEAARAHSAAQDREEIAYKIAGLLSTKLANQLPETSLLMQILFLAGELELPEKHRSADASWKRFFQLVEKL